MARQLEGQHAARAPQDGRDVDAQLWRCGEGRSGARESKGARRRRRRRVAAGGPARRAAAPPVPPGCRRSCRSIQLPARAQYKRREAPRSTTAHLQAAGARRQTSRRPRRPGRPACHTSRLRHHTAAPRQRCTTQRLQPAQRRGVAAASIARSHATLSWQQGCCGRERRAGAAWRPNKGDRAGFGCGKGVRERPSKWSSTAKRSGRVDKSSGGSGDMDRRRQSGGRAGGRQGAVHSACRSHQPCSGLDGLLQWTPLPRRGRLAPVKAARVWTRRVHVQQLRWLWNAHLMRVHQLGNARLQLSNLQAGSRQVGLARPAPTPRHRSLCRVAVAAVLGCARRGSARLKRLHSRAAPA